MTAKSTKNNAAENSNLRTLSEKEYQSLLKELKANPAAVLEQMTVQLASERVMLGAAIRNRFMKELATAKIDPSLKFAAVCVLEDVLLDLQLVPLKEADNGKI